MHSIELIQSLKTLSENNHDWATYYALLTSAKKLRDAAQHKLSRSKSSKTVERYTRHVAFQSEMIKNIRSELTKLGADAAADALLMDLIGAPLGTEVAFYAGRIPSITCSFVVEGIRCRSNHWIYFEGTNAKGLSEGLWIHAEALSTAAGIMSTLRPAKV